MSSLRELLAKARRAELATTATVVTCTTCGEMLASFPQREVDAQPRAFHVLVDQTRKKHRRDAGCAGVVSVKSERRTTT